MRDQGLDTRDWANEKLIILDLREQKSFCTGEIFKKIAPSAPAKLKFLKSSTFKVNFFDFSDFIHRPTKASGLTSSASWKVLLLEQLERTKAFLWFGFSR